MGHPGDAKAVHNLLGRYNDRSAARAAIRQRYDRQGNLHLDRLVRPAGQLSPTQEELVAKAAALHRELAEECQAAGDERGTIRHMNAAHALVTPR